MSKRNNNTLRDDEILKYFESLEDGADDSDSSSSDIDKISDISDDDTPPKKVGCVSMI